MLDLLNSIISIPLASIAVGALITWVAAWYYYKRAGEELKQEAARLRKTTEIILRWLENRGENIEVIRDETGAPISLCHNQSIVESIQSSGGSLVSGEFGTVKGLDAQLGAPSDVPVSEQEKRAQN